MLRNASELQHVADRLSSGKIEAVLKCYDKMIALNPASISSHKKKALFLVKSKRLEEALPVLQTVLMLKPEETEALDNVSYIYYIQGKVEEAIIYCKKSREIVNNPTDPSFATNLGWLYRKLNKNEEALSYFEEAVQIDPTNHRAQYGLGVTLLEMNRKEEAIKCFNNTIESEAEGPVKSLMKACAHYQLDQLDEALDMAQEVVYDDPGYVMTLNLNGVLYAAMGNIKEAIWLFEMAVEYQKTYFEGYFNKANLLFDLGRLEEALEFFDLAIMYNIHQSTSYYNKALVLQGLKRYGEALACYEKCIEINGGDHEAYYNMGNVLYSLGKPNEAKECYEKVIEINSKYDEAHYNMDILINELENNLSSVHAFKNAGRKPMLI